MDNNNYTNKHLKAQVRGLMLCLDDTCAEIDAKKLELRNKTHTFIDQVINLEKQLAKVINDNYRLKAELQAAGIFSCPSNLFNQEK